MAIRSKEILFIFLLIKNFYSSYGCWMQGVNNWAIPQGATILDTYRGIVIDREIGDIEGITDVSFWEGLNGGPYLTVAIVDSRFVISTNDAYEDYEEYETENSMSVSVSFRCTSGSTVSIRAVVEVDDTNNNPPRFLPSSELDYTIYTPLPPGSIITGCFDGITVRDIDLTTERIDFAIEENSYFEIEYDAAASNTDKEFIGVIKTTTFIRSLPEPITLRIYATDVDRTNDPPHTSNATITIKADAEFELPEEPVFTQTFYFADYSDNNQVTLAEPISLLNGFDEFVQFTLYGEFSSNFQVVSNANQISLNVVTALPENLLREKQIFLIVRADREYTSGASATVIVRLPEVVPLIFEKSYYEGRIEHNFLHVATLILTQGYEGQTVSVQVFGEYGSYFSTNIQNNEITLFMEPLSNTIINENNIIALEIAASSGFDTATTIVTLEIIKDDMITPVFNKPIYEGSYNTDTGLTLEEILFDQGYDETVELSLEGEYSNLFTIAQNGLAVRLSTTGISPAIFIQQQILLTLQATKPRTVGANAAIVITLPAARQLDFEESTYRGTLQHNVLSLEPINLSAGYDENVLFSITGEHQNYFTIIHNQNQVTITLGTAISENILRDNNLIILTVKASGLNAVSTTTSVIIDIIKEDITTPVFSHNIYQGMYQGTMGVIIENINLVQGYGEDVTFELQGDHAEHFIISNIENNVAVSLRNYIPEELIYNEKVLVLTVVANKPLTVGANAAITIRFSSELTDPVVMRFAQNTYNAVIENNNLRTDNIILSTGYHPDTIFSLSGDNYVSNFAISNEENIVSITLVNELPMNEIESAFIVLELEARRERAVSASTSLVVYIVPEEIQPLVFSKPYYLGVYNEEQETLSVEEISLALGYDDSVTFELEGDFSVLFSISNTASNSLTIVPTTSLPVEVLENNNHIMFAILASKPDTNDARAAIAINIERDQTKGSVLGFDRVTYVGSIESTMVTLDPIRLVEGYTDEVTFSLQGDLATYFTISSQGAGNVRVTLPVAIPDQMIPANRLIVIEIRASAPQALSAYATIVFEVIVEGDFPAVPQLIFDATYYTGSYTATTDVTLDTPISLAQGYDQSVNFVLEGNQAQWFDIVQNENSITLTASSSIPSGILANNAQLVFVIAAQRLGTDTARATIVISLSDDYTDGLVLGFDRVTYVGSIESTMVTLDPITLVEGYTDEVTFSLQGDLATYFTISSQGGGIVSVTLPAAIPDQMIPANRLIVLVIRASAPQALSAYATIVFEVIVEDDLPSVPQLIFDATYYTGSYTATTGVTLDTPISLAQGYDQSVNFVLEGDQAQWFDIVRNENSITLTVSSSIPSGILANNAQLVFVIAAQRLGSDTARATIVISLSDDYTDGLILGFDRVTYVGSIESTMVTLNPITLVDGYTDEVTFSLQGDLATYFTISSQGVGIVSVTLPTAIPDQMIPANRLIVLDIRASAPQALSAYATIVFEVIVESDLPSVPQLIFDATYYTGSYKATTGVTLDTPISLAQGYDRSVNFVLEGNQSQWFDIVRNKNSITLTVSSSIPSDVLNNNPQFVFVIRAQRSGSNTARATIVISLTNDLQTEEDVLFDKLIYKGIVQLGVVQHESITIINYSETSIQLHGEYSTLFEARLMNGVVAVQALLSLPDDVTQVVLELHAANARAVLLLQATQTDDPILPSVTFSSPSYVLSIEIVQQGVVGRVLATADNGEAVAYSLSVDNAHLQTRISINNEGELFLSAPANSGVYTFQVIATTVITRAQGMAVVHLTVEAITICGDNEIVVPPLIILERDEEEPHRNLVTLDKIQGEACYFTLSNRWPHEQDWLYVDENGLHAKSIDREHESIAFMALSQVQVELVLHCENDSATRSKRFRADRLGPYDYGTSKWILTESIPYNSRRSLVNLIVNDINDNAPIFIGKELEPIVVGYPIRELEDRILPRSLAELQATDADIGENAALLYWSSEDVLAVAPTTGFIHLRSGAQLANNQMLTVSATDQRGQGLTGNIQLLVKLLDLSNIVVVTVKDAFLDDESNILAQLSEAVGYKVKVLRSVVISDDLEEAATNVSRNKRDINTTQASLMLYVYGLIQNEPVFVDRLTMDINSNAATVNVVNTISLEDHLELDLISGSNIRFMVATIVLSVLLFIVIVIIAIWFFLTWRKNKNYNEFPEENSLASRNASVEQLPKPDISKPRLNIEDLKRSEKRLQDMLSTPIEAVTVEAMSPRKDVPVEAIIDLTAPETNPPIVIQSIDKLKDSDDVEEDEFGEISGTRRKSVVTFNENVEKIIHVEDNDDDKETISSENSYEIYKL